MKTLYCKCCKKDVTFVVVKKSNNNVASCSECNHFLKNVSNNDLGIKTVGHIFPFGKYKGTKISECNDVDYMDWFLKNVDISKSIKDEVFERILKID